MAHAQKPDLVFQRHGQVHLNRRGCQFSRLLAAEECGSADSNCIDRVPTYSARLLATHSIRIFPLHFPSRVSPCAIRFWTCCTTRDMEVMTASCIIFMYMIIMFNIHVILFLWSIVLLKYKLKPLLKFLCVLKLFLQDVMSFNPKYQIYHFFFEDKKLFHCDYLLTKI